MSGKSQQEHLAGRAYAASPLGIAAVIAGVVCSIVFLLRFNTILNDVSNDDLRAAIQALEITVIAVWVGIALWGWYLIRDGMERANTNKRLNEQDSTLSRIERAIADIDREKEEIHQKSRSFWNFRRGDGD
jgi:high-affinity Fe2+/Pb2+ permease